MGPPLLKLSLVALVWPRGGLASTTCPLAGKGAALPEVTKCLAARASSSPATRAEADEELQALGKEIRNAFEAARLDPLGSVRAHAEQALVTLAGASHDSATTEKSNTIPQARGRKVTDKMNRVSTQAALARAVQHLGARVEGLPQWVQDAAGAAQPEHAVVKDSATSRRLAVYGAPGESETHNDTWLLENCENDPDFSFMWGDTCEHYNFIPCEVDDFFGASFIGWGYLTLEHWQRLPARCPRACGLCDLPNSSSAELLERCEDAPQFWSHDPVNVAYGCSGLITGGYCIGQPTSPWIGMKGSEMTVKMCPRSCNLCSKCLEGTYITSNVTTIRDSDPDFCVPCPAGTYTDERDQQQCTECPQGQFTDTVGSTQCTKCPLGSHMATTGATECTTCDPAGTGMWTTRNMIQMDANTLKMAISDGSKSNSSCGCKEGFLPQDASCLKCGEGLDCDGVRPSPLVADGYYSSSDEPFSVFRCRENPKACPHGQPGECAVNRKGTSLVCGVCEDGYVPASNGGCEPCGGGGVVPIVFIIIFVCLFMAAVYKVVSMENRAKQKTGTVLITLSLGFLVSLGQQLKVFSLLDLEWQEPFKSVLGIMTIFGFDLEAFGLDCMGRFSPVVKFALNLVNIVVLLGILALVHIIYVAKIGKNGAHTHLIANCYGTIFMTFATAISSLTFAPFQCMGHPSGKATMKGYPTVICWEAGDHPAMVAIGIVATIIFLAAVTVCVTVVRMIPYKMRQGDTNFLRGAAFLFARFRAGSHYYSLVCLLKGVMVALVPVLPNALSQCFLLVILLVYSIATTYVLPWRLFQACCLDVGITTSLVMTLTLALFFADKPDLIMVSKFCCAIVGIALGTVAIVIGYGLAKKYLFKTKPFQYFLCHHKGGCGSFARLMKIHMLENSKVKSKVFLDSDDLQDLNRLFDYVREDLGTLVVLCSKEILMRPWCAGEITTARMCNVPVTLVVFPDFSFPDEEMISNYGKLVPGCEGLAPHGIDESMVQETLRWVKHNPTITFDSDVSMESVNGLVTAVVKDAALKDRVSIDVKRQLTSGKDKVIILSDLAYSEASSTAYVLEKMLAPHLLHNAHHMPRVLPDGEDLPKSTSQIILICSRGCFRNPNLVKALLQANVAGSTVFPAVSEEAFRFPTEPFFDELRIGGQELMKAAGSDEDIEVLVHIIRTIFSEIAVVLHAWNDSHVDLDVRTEVIAKRLLSGGARLSTVGGRSPKPDQTNQNNVGQNTQEPPEGATQPEKTNELDEESLANIQFDDESL